LNGFGQGGKCTIQNSPGPKARGCFVFGVERFRELAYNGGMETLAKLFGGQARVKIMRLFLLNNESTFEIEEVVSRSRVTKANSRKEVNALLAMGFIKQKTVVHEGTRGAKKKVPAWQLNPVFPYVDSIRDLLVDPSLLLREDLAARFKQVGKVKLMIVSGIFIGSDKSRVDILVVGDKLKKNIIQQIIKGLESEIGKELNYVVLESEEFKYRIDMYDKLVCDIIESAHERIIDNGQLSTYISKK